MRPLPRTSLAPIGALLILVFSAGCIGSLSRNPEAEGSVGGAAPSPPAIAPGAAQTGRAGASPVPQAGTVASPVAEVGPSYTVNMVEGDNQYSPITLDIPVGARVTWHNASEIEHTVTADPASSPQDTLASLPRGADPFASGAIAPNGDFTHVFIEPGEYRYYCQFHWEQGMVGTITVGSEPVTPQ